jgi:hypothetical protein
MAYPEVGVVVTQIDVFAPILPPVAQLRLDVLGDGGRIRRQVVRARQRERQDANPEDQRGCHEHQPTTSHVRREGHVTPRVYDEGPILYEPPRARVSRGGRS